MSRVIFDTANELVGDGAAKRLRELLKANREAALRVKKG